MVTRAVIAFCCVFACALTAHAQLPDFTVLIEENSTAVVKITAVEAKSSRRRESIPQGQIPDALRDCSINVAVPSVRLALWVRVLLFPPMDISSPIIMWLAQPSTLRCV